MNIAANATSTVISPLAFKLTLLGLSAVSNPNTESAINQLLFDEAALSPSSLNQLLTLEGQNFVRTQMNLTEQVRQRKAGGSGLSVKEQLSSLLKPLVGSSSDANYKLCMNFKEGMNAGIAALCTGYVSSLPFLPKDPQVTFVYNAFLLVATSFKLFCLLIYFLSTVSSPADRSPGDSTLSGVWHRQLPAVH